MYDAEWREEPLIITTTGFRSLDPDQGYYIVRAALRAIQADPKIEFIAFDPHIETSVIEDEGRTLILPARNLFPRNAPQLTEEVYAKLDDYGSVENLRRHSGIHVNTRFTLTFMLADEY